jgi:hypothetical protein
MLYKKSVWQFCRVELRGIILTCQVAYLLPLKPLPDTPYVIPSAIKDLIPPPAPQIEALSGCSCRVQYLPTSTLRMRERHVSKASRKNRHVASVAKEFVAAMQVVTIPQSRTIVSKYRPIGNFCIKMELGYWAKR